MFERIMTVVPIRTIVPPTRRVPSQLQTHLESAIRLDSEISDPKTNLPGDGTDHDRSGHG